MSNDPSMAVGQLAMNLAVPGAKSFPSNGDLSTYLLLDKLGFQDHKPLQAQQMAPVSVAMRALASNPILQTAFGTGPDAVKAVHDLIQRNTAMVAGLAITAPHIADSVMANGGARVASITGAIGGGGGFWGDDDKESSLTGRMKAVSQIDNFEGLTEFAKKLSGQMGVGTAGAAGDE